MAGATIQVRLDDAQVQRAVGRLIRLGQDLVPLARAIGVVLVRGTQDRFHDEQDPEGRPWAPLHPDYAALKRGPGILRESGQRGGLYGSISFRVHGGPQAAAVSVGSNKIYAAIHQLGGTIKPVRGEKLFFRDGRGRVWGAAKSVTIPARPYLGLSREDRRAVRDVVATVLARAARAG